jgi:hypothetical protein
MPVPQLPPAGHARAEAELLRQELPSDAGVEHEQDARQDLPVIQTPAARMTGTARHDRQAALLEGAAEGLRRRVGLRAWPHLRRVEADLVAQVRQRLGAARFDQAFSAAPGSPSSRR